MNYYIELKEVVKSKAYAIETDLSKPIYYTGIEFNQYQFSEDREKRKVYSDLSGCADVYALLKNHIHSIRNTSSYNNRVFVVEIKTN